MRYVFIQAKRFKIRMCRIENFPTGRFIYAATLHADKSVFHNVQKPDTVLAAYLVERKNNLFRTHLFIVQGNRTTLFKFERDIRRFVGRLQGRYPHFQEAFLFILRLVARVFQIQALVAQMPKVLILGIIRFTVNLQRHVVRFRVIDFFFTRFDRPFSPRRDNRHIRRKRLDRKLETHLIVALTRATVADRVRSFLFRNLHDPLCDHGTRKRRAEQIFFIFRPRHHGGHDVIINEFVREIFHVKFGSARLDRLFFQAVQLVRLSNVSAHRNHFAVVIILFQPRDNNRSIQPSRIRKHYLFNIFLFHKYRSPYIYALIIHRYTPIVNRFFPFI